MLKIGIISNPFAKVNRKKPDHNMHLWYTLAQAGPYEITHSPDEPCAICQEFEAHGINFGDIFRKNSHVALRLSDLNTVYKDPARLWVDSRRGFLFATFLGSIFLKKYNKHKNDSGCTLRAVASHFLGNLQTRLPHFNSKPHLKIRAEGHSRGPPLALTA